MRAPPSPDCRSTPARAQSCAPCSRPSLSGSPRSMTDCGNWPRPVTSWWARAARWDTPPPGPRSSPTPWESRSRWATTRRPRRVGPPCSPWRPWAPLPRPPNPRYRSCGRIRSATPATGVPASGSDVCTTTLSALATPERIDVAATMRIAIGCDDTGFPLKEPLVSALEVEGHDVLDLGTFSAEPVDYPDYARAVGQAVLRGFVDASILLCVSGAGGAMAANKMR